MNQRPEQGEYTEAQAGYIALVPPEGDILTILREQSKEVLRCLAGSAKNRVISDMPRRSGASRRWSAT